MQLSGKQLLLIGAGAMLGSVAGGIAYRYVQTSEFVPEPTGVLFAGLGAAIAVLLVKLFNRTR